MKLFCRNCGKEFSAKWKKRKYCSHSCYCKKRRHSKKWLRHLKKIGFQKGHDNGLKGTKKPEFSGENHPSWKGDLVGYTALHEWVRSRFPKTESCQCCKSKPPIDLANKGVYNRDLENWEWLCRSCHMKKDGRTERFIKSGDPTGRKHSDESRNKMSVARKLYWNKKKGLL